MNNNDVKAVAAASQSSGNTKPGAVHVSGVDARTNQCATVGLDQCATIPEDAHEDEVNDNPLIRKLRGELPDRNEYNCAIPTNINDRATIPVTTEDAREDEVNGNPLIRKLPGELPDRNEYNCAIPTNINDRATIPVTTEDPQDSEVNDNPLIRKLRGELPVRNEHTCANQTSPNDRVTIHPVTTEGVHDDEDNGNSLSRKLCGELSYDQYDQNRPSKCSTPTFHFHQADSILNDDLETGDIAVALPADEVDGFIPTAVEFDSDAKPSTRSRNPRVSLYIFVALTTMIIGIVGVIMGLTLTKTGSEEKDPMNSTTSAYRERVATFVSDEQLDDSTNPYHKALDWITNKDPMLTTPDSPRLIQRFILAYFYFATSTRQPWVNECAPPSNESDNVICIHTFQPYKSEPTALQTQTAFKWLSNTDECEWAGLQCDLKFQIREIEFGGIGMTGGTFPLGIVNLPYLQRLDLRSSELEGPLPEFRDSFKNLLSVKLFDNKFTGTIPEEWFQSRSLQNIDIESNRIKGSISSSFSRLFDLSYLNLGSNLLTGTIPTEIGAVRNVKILSLKRNKLHGGIPTSLGQMKYLQAFIASSTSVTGTIPKEVGDIKSLQDFYVDGNLLTGKIPEEFWKATNLYTVNVADNSLTGTISRKITNQVRLAHLNIGNNQFTGSIPARIGTTGIETIVASGNMFNGTIAPQLCDLVEKGQLSVLELDCAPAINATGSSENTAEIICPTGCCTLCCTPDGKTCRPN